MNKFVIIAAIAATGTGAYLYNQQHSSPAYNVLDYVPADTPLFAAQLEPFPLKDYLASAPNIVDPTDNESIDALYDPAMPGLNFLLSLNKTYQAGLSDADLFIKTFGLPEDVRAYFYTLGLLPVFKIEIANEKAIWDLLDKTELETGFAHKEGSLKNISYRAYPITPPEDPVNAELIVMVNEGLLTVTVNSAYTEVNTLEMALGFTKSDQPLSKAGTIEEIIKQHDFKAASVGFINHIEIIKGLTTTDGNQLAKQISKFEANLGAESALATIRNAECATDLSSIANNWPRTVAGYTQLDISAQESTISVSTIIESKNQVILKALSALRGFIPKYTNDIEHNVFAMGLGFDVSQLANSVNSIWSDLQTPTYTCQPLADIQTQITASGDSVAMLGMSASMANGIQGTSIGLLDYSVSNIETTPQLDSLDALFTLSAENPEQLFNTVKMFVPELQQIQLVTNGEAVDLSTILPIPSELNITPKLAIKGKHLVVYNGQKGEQAANQISDEKLTKNGLYSVAFDFKKMVMPIVTATELAGETIPPEAKFLTEYDARMKMSMDFNDTGIIFKSSINNKAPK